MSWFDYDYNFEEDAEYDERGPYSWEKMKEKNRDCIYNRESDTKYHIGDRFVHPTGMTAIVTKISDDDESYSLSFVETSTGREVGAGLHNAWWSRKDLDNFMESVEKFYFWE